MEAYVQAKTGDFRDQFEEVLHSASSKLGVEEFSKKTVELESQIS